MGEGGEGNWKCWNPSDLLCPPPPSSSFSLCLHRKNRIDLIPPPPFPSCFHHRRPPPPVSFPLRPCFYCQSPPRPRRVHTAAAAAWPCSWAWASAASCSSWGPGRRCPSWRPFGHRLRLRLLRSPPRLRFPPSSRPGPGGASTVLCRTIWST